MAEINPKQVVYAPAATYPCPWGAAENNKHSVGDMTEAIVAKEISDSEDLFVCRECGRSIQIVGVQHVWMVSAKPAVGVEVVAPVKSTETICEKCGASTLDMEAHLAVDADGRAIFCKPKIECPLCGVMTVDLTKHLLRDSEDKLLHCPGKKQVAEECPLCGDTTIDLQKHLEKDTTGKLLYCRGKPFEKPPEDKEEVCPDCGSTTLNLTRHKQLSCFGPRK